MDGDEIPGFYVCIGDDGHQLIVDGDTSNVEDAEALLKWLEAAIKKMKEYVRND